MSYWRALSRPGAGRFDSGCTDDDLLAPRLAVAVVATIGGMKPLLCALLCAAIAAAQAPAPTPEQQAAARQAAQERLLRDFSNLARYHDENAPLAPPAAGENRVVFTGDSITDFWGRRAGQFFPGKPYVNRGIS